MNIIWCVGREYRLLGHGSNPYIFHSLLHTAMCVQPVEALNNAQCKLHVIMSADCTKTSEMNNLINYINLKRN